MSGPRRPLSIAGRRGSGPSEEIAVAAANNINSSRLDMLEPQALLHQNLNLNHRQMRGPPTPSLTSTSNGNFDQSQCQSQQSSASQPSPPTPAASPGPSHIRPEWSSSSSPQSTEMFLASARQHFAKLNNHERNHVMSEMLKMCTSRQLSFVYQFVTPLLKKDPFISLPDELCLRVSFYISPAKLRSAPVILTRYFLLPCRFFHLSTIPRLLPAPRRFRAGGVIC